MATLIKRYANRKLYNTQTSRYITLRGIAELIENGDDIRVVDNESGEDITATALSQILVDSNRSKGGVPHSLVAQIFERGGDAIYTALRRGVDDATEGLEDLQDRIRKIIPPIDPKPWRRGPGHDGASSEGGELGAAVGTSAHPDSAEVAPTHSTPETRSTATGPLEVDAQDDFERRLREAVAQVATTLDLPSRSDIRELNRNLARLHDVIATLGSRTSDDDRSNSAPTSDEESS